LIDRVWPNVYFAVAEKKIRSTLKANSFFSPGRNGMFIGLV